MTKALLVLLGVAVGFALAQLPHALSNAIEAGKAKRFIADVRGMTAQLEGYRAEHSAYPVGCDVTTLPAHFKNGNVSFGPNVPAFHYCSDGQQYLLAFVPFGGGEYLSAYGAPVVVTNNRLISWPSAGGRPADVGRSAETTP